jgi:hypothetical protein
MEVEGDGRWDPGVIEKVSGGSIVAEGHIKTLIAIVSIIGGLSSNWTENRGKVRWSLFGYFLPNASKR